MIDKCMVATSISGMQQSGLLVVFFVLLLFLVGKKYYTGSQKQGAGSNLEK